MEHDLSEHALIQSEDTHGKIHGLGKLGQFNAFLAVKITNTVGTVWCAYAFTLLALISLPAAIATHDSLIIVAWIAQTFLQLVLLPLLMVGQRVISAAQDARAETDHQTLMLLQKINETQLAILKRLDH
jgi:hypothetical protein